MYSNDDNLDGKILTVIYSIGLHVVFNRFAMENVVLGVIQPGDKIPYEEYLDALEMKGHEQYMIREAVQGKVIEQDETITVQPMENFCRQFFIEQIETMFAYAPKHKNTSEETDIPQYKFGLYEYLSDLYKIYKENNIEMTKEIAILCLSSIISDTLLFKSPTCTEDDIKVANALQKIANIDMQEYGLEMLKAGTDLGEFSEEELVNLDAKAFDKGDTKFVIAQVNTVSIEDVLKRQQELESAINSEIDKKGLQLFVFAITDILNSNSEIIALGNRTDAVEKAFDVKLENHRAFLPGVVSRKKQILPNIDKNI